MGGDPVISKTEKEGFRWGTKKTRLVNINNPNKRKKQGVGFQRPDGRGQGSVNCNPMAGNGSGERRGPGGTCRGGERGIPGVKNKEKGD